MLGENLFDPAEALARQFVERGLAVRTANLVVIGQQALIARTQLEARSMGRRLLRASETRGLRAGGSQHRSAAARRAPTMRIKDPGEALAAGSIGDLGMEEPNSQPLD